MDKINSLRNEIDSIDNELMKLLSSRFDLSNTIGKIKSKSNKEVLDQSRELTILNQTKKHQYSSQIEAVYKTILNESKNIQRK